MNRAIARRFDVDNDRLNRLLNDSRERQYWLKAVGPPGDDEAYNRPVTRPFANEFIKTHFTDRQRGRSVIENISEGDIFIAYWTGIRVSVHGPRVACVQRGAEVRAEAGGRASP